MQRCLKDYDYTVVPEQLKNDFFFGRAKMTYVQYVISMGNENLFEQILIERFDDFIEGKDSVSILS